jgi:hypothetical protein
MYVDSLFLNNNDGLIKKTPIKFLSKELVWNVRLNIFLFFLGDGDFLW